MDQVQSRAVVMDSEPCPPAAANADGELLALTWHLSAVGALIDVCVELQAARETRATACTARADIRQRIPRYLPQSPRHNQSR
jgi:hypothetical protein